MQRLKQIYQENVIPKLNNRSNYSHSQKVPKLVKIVINRGFSESFQNAKILESSFVLEFAKIVKMVYKAIFLLFCVN